MNKEWQTQHNLLDRILFYYQSILPPTIQGMLMDRIRTIWAVQENQPAIAG